VAPQLQLLQGPKCGTASHTQYVLHKPAYVEAQTSLDFQLLLLSVIANLTLASLYYYVQLLFNQPIFQISLQFRLEVSQR